MIIILILSYEQWLAHKDALVWLKQVENKDLHLALVRRHFEAIMQEFWKNTLPDAPMLQSEFREYIQAFTIGGIFMLLQTWLQDDLKHSPETMGTLTYELVVSGIFRK